MKICFSSRPALDELSVLLFGAVRDILSEDLDAVFVVSNPIQARKLRGRLEGQDVVDLASYVRKTWHQWSKDTFAAFEEEYDCEPLWQYIYTDRFLIDRSYDYVLRSVSSLFGFYESLFAEGNVDYYYDETIATLQSYVAYIVGRKHGVTYLGQMVARGLDGTHHYLVNDPYQHMEGFDPSYENREFSEDIVLRAKELLCSAESKSRPPANMSFVRSRPRFDLRWLTSGTRLFFSGEFHDRYDYINYHAYLGAFRGFMLYFRFRRSKKHYLKPDLGQKYVYFPLHYQPEASTLVCAPKYEKQLFFIDSWAKSLPADTLLYVKEHYAVLGHRDPEFYSALRQYPNVRVIDPFEDSGRLVRGAVAVTTLTGTAGWEAMLLRKPVFLGGRILFDNAPGVVRVPDVFGNYLSLLRQWREPSREEVVNYLCEYLSNVYPGCAYLWSPMSTSDENVVALARSLVGAMERASRRDLS